MRPLTITLCGSIRFLHLFDAWNEALSCAGHVVFHLGMRGRRPNDADKFTLDDVHKRKIAASDAVLVLNRFAYIGESTMSEFEHAHGRDKEIRFLESWGKGQGIGRMHNDETRALAQSYGVPDGYGSPLNTSLFRCWPHDWFGDAIARRGRLVQVVSRALVASPA